MYRLYRLEIVLNERRNKNKKTIDHIHSSLTRRPRTLIALALTLVRLSRPRRSCTLLNRARALTMSPRIYPSPDLSIILLKKLNTRNAFRQCTEIEFHLIFKKILYFNRRATRQILIFILY